jgi:hypothetical protein
MHWETKNSCDTLYCGDLEPNLQYLRGILVLVSLEGGNVTT